MLRGSPEWYIPQLDAVDWLSLPASTDAARMSWHHAKSASHGFKQTVVMPGQQRAAID